uniref:Uncharacterized protein n=1 Tax=Arundo donax TaxID=35708 RepID=A0A0A8Z3P3_ARUDO
MMHVRRHGKVLSCHCLDGRASNSNTVVDLIPEGGLVVPE